MDDLVLLSTANMRVKGFPRKLQRRFVGPFRIVAKVGKVAYKLDLPNTWRIHNVFHVSLLRPWRESQWTQEGPSTQIELEEETNEPEVERFLCYRWIGEGRNRHRELLVLWRNTSIDSATWVSEHEFSDDDFHFFFNRDKPIETEITPETDNEFEDEF